MPDLTRLTDGLMGSGSVWLVTTDWQRRLERDDFSSNRHPLYLFV
jgi:hypothetical protein